MRESMSTEPAQLPAEARHAGEVRARWAWVQSSVWTERMLTALEQGVKGGKWHSLNQCWPNAFFAEHGLFSLSAAYATARQSAKR